MKLISSPVCNLKLINRKNRRIFPDILNFAWTKFFAWKKSRKSRKKSVACCRSRYKTGRLRKEPQSESMESKNVSDFLYGTARPFAGLTYASCHSTLTRDTTRHDRFLPSSIFNEWFDLETIASLYIHSFRSHRNFSKLFLIPAWANVYLSIDRISKHRGNTVWENFRTHELYNNRSSCSRYHNALTCHVRVYIFIYK